MGQIEIDRGAPEPVYEQLANWIRRGIQRGRWKPRERIPSIEWLAEESGLSVFTVQRGIRVVKDEGLVYGVPGKGTFVAGKQ